jgi:toxin YoeB
VLPGEKILACIGALIKDIKRNPSKGLGKPEPLKHALQGWWSRRILGEHRLVYRVSGKGGEQRVEVVQCRYHY